VKVAKTAGMKELILTAKHHDGFCLWPSAYTEHSIKNSPYKNGKGDIVKEFTNACRKYGIKPGLYLSPWDRNAATYGTPAYIDYYKKQLKELLTRYGPIYEIWFDGANGGDGYYGGARETRKIDSKTYYPWKELFNIVYTLQPAASIFSDAGPDVRWIGNEKGFAGETFWSPINDDQLIIGASDPEYLNTGEPFGKKWLVGVCDVSIRPGWFYHKKEDSLVRTASNLVDLYYKSVGRNAVFLLNLAPDKNGLIHINDIRSLEGFRKTIDESFKINLAKGAKAKHKKLLPNSKNNIQNLVDPSNGTFWMSDRRKNDTIEIQLSSTKKFDRLLLQEPIQLGQRIAAFEVWAFENNEWNKIAEGTTVGYKRLIKTPVTKSQKLKLIIVDALDKPAISNFAVYKASILEGTDD
jgi:alpha-L-fucosidase